MIRFSSLSVSVALSENMVLSEPTQALGGRPVLHFTSLFIVAPASRALRPGSRSLGLSYAYPGRVFPALTLPALNRGAQLEEGDDPRRDRQPEGDHAVGENGGEHLCARQPEEHEGADHAGIDRAHSPRGEGDQVGEHAEEEALDHDAE